MKLYKKIFLNEEFNDQYIPDPKVINALKNLRDKDFGNEESRKGLMELLVVLHNSKDKIARKALKRVGDLFTEIGDELLQLSKEYQQEGD